MAAFNFNTTLANGASNEAIIISFDTISKLDILSDQEIDIVVVPPGGTFLGTTKYTLAANTQLVMPVGAILLFGSNASGVTANLTVAGIGTNSAVVVDGLTLVNEAIFGESDIKHFPDGSDDNVSTEVIWDDTLKKAFNRATFAAPAQDFWFLFPVRLPTTFRAFKATALEMEAKSSAAGATYEVLGIIDTDGTERSTGLPAAGNSLTVDTVEVANTVGAFTSGTFDRGKVMYVKVRVAGGTAETVDVWNQIKVNIL